MALQRVVVIGAGIGGLSAAMILAARGLRVTVLDAADGPGGKMRELVSAGFRIDAGPTVLTMRHVIAAIFADAGACLDDAVTLMPLAILARHSWLSRSGQRDRLDLHSDRDASAAAIAAFAGAAEAQRYVAFCDRAHDIHDTLESNFMTVERPSQSVLVMRAGLAAMWRTKPFSSMWNALAESFQDERLRQLYGRYATYCGSSPFLAPATLMLIAHVEQQGVWAVSGGMHHLARAMADLVTARGGTIRYCTPASHILLADGRVTGVATASGDVIAAEAVISNVDTNAIAAGLFGDDARKAVVPTSPGQRALSAVTFAVAARTQGFGLSRHNVFFSGNYRAEFDDLAAGRVPNEPTIYVCAQDRDGDGTHMDGEPERLLILVNAPPNGDKAAWTAQEIDACQAKTVALLARHGLAIAPLEPPVVTTPDRFEALFPGTGGALYGRATHGAMASFTRPASRSAVKGLYLTGGSVHPGAGVPMAALSGRIAASSLLQDCGLTPLSPLAAMLGGTSMR